LALTIFLIFFDLDPLFHIPWPYITTTLKAQNVLVDRFEPALWCGPLDFVTVCSEDDVRFTFKDGTEIKA